MLVQKENFIVLSVKVIPNASRTQVVGPLGKPPTALKVKVAQPPEDGRANRAAMALLAEVLDIPPGHVTLLTGQTRPLKQFRLAGITLEDATRRLAAPTA